jgi:hypothetical protein
VCQFNSRRVSPGRAVLPSSGAAASGILIRGLKACCLSYPREEPGALAAHAEPELQLLYEVGGEQFIAIQSGLERNALNINSMTRELRGMRNQTLLFVLVFEGNHQIEPSIAPSTQPSFWYMNTNPKKGDNRVAEKSAIQRIKDLDAERASIFDGAKEEALEKAKAAVAELNDLGFNYTLTNGAGKQAKARSGKGKRTIKAAACPTCEFQTTPPHDGRTHRNQKKKGPFSTAELKEKGLMKV